MLESLRKWLITLVGVALFAGAVVGLAECDRSRQQAPVAKQIDTLLLERHDTLIRIDSVLKYKVKVVHDLAPDATDSAFDSAIPADTFYLPSDTIKQAITVYQEKRCIEAVDSLSAYKQIVHVDSSVIDTLAKIGLEKAPESGGLIHDLKVFGSGLLVGAGIRSFF